jgi:hypothetical protein
MSTDCIDDEPFNENFDLSETDSEELEFDLDETDSEELEFDLDEIDTSPVDDVIPGEDSEEDSEVVLSKHQIQDKHRLKYDSIFKGKKEDPMDEFEMMTSGFNETFEVDRQSNYWFESIDNENYVRDKQVKEKVYEVLKSHTELNFQNNRRKPSKIDFNSYYSLLKSNLSGDSFTNVELFVELSVYFSDNLFNMFRLLDSKWKNMIVAELQNHIGKQNYSNEVMNRNIYVGTEIEFITKDLTGEYIHVTGVVEETIYQDSRFNVNSYEKMYDVHLSDITKILKNTKFRYNLTKLSNVDFL